jgi:hypothetical protein
LPVHVVAGPSGMACEKSDRRADAHFAFAGACDIVVALLRNSN